MLTQPPAHLFETVGEIDVSAHGETWLGTIAWQSLLPDKREKRHDILRGVEGEWESEERGDARRPSCLENAVCGRTGEVDRD